jgi:hypothetical protein
MFTLFSKFRPYLSSFPFMGIIPAAAAAAAMAAARAAGVFWKLKAAAAAATFPSAAAIIDRYVSSRADPPSPGKSLGF